MRQLLLTFAFAPLVTQAASPVTAVLLPDRTLAFVVVIALFYFGFRWRVR